MAMSSRSQQYYTGIIEPLPDKISGEIFVQRKTVSFIMHKRDTEKAGLAAKRRTLHSRMRTHKRWAQARSTELKDKKM